MLEHILGHHPLIARRAADVAERISRQAVLGVPNGCDVVLFSLTSLAAAPLQINFAGSTLSKLCVFFALQNAINCRCSRYFCAVAYVLARIVEIDVDNYSGSRQTRYCIY